MIILYVRVVHLGNDIEMPFQKGVLADVCGPMQTLSLSNNIYFVVSVDDFSRMTWVYFIKHKSEVLFIFKKFKLLVESQSGYYLKILRIDRGGEFLSHEFNIFCETCGIW